MPTTNIVAHSYGTTTAAQALSTTGVSVDRFVSLGSAGLPNAVDSAGKLHAEHVYAGQARNVLPDEKGTGDEWAITGRTLGSGHRVDPSTEVFGATTFGTDGTTSVDGAELRPVLHHDPLNADGTGYLDRDTESLHNVAFATTGHDDQLTAYHPKPLNDRDQRWIDRAEFVMGAP